MQNAQWTLEARIEGGLPASHDGVLCLTLRPTTAHVEELPQRDIVMLLDASGSMSHVWDPVCREACAIVDALPQGARISVMAFSEDKHVLVDRCPLGTLADRAALKHQLMLFKPPFLGTNMGKAVRCAVDALSDPAPRSPHLLAPASALHTVLAPPMMFLATDGRSSDAVDMADLLRRQPDLTVHVTAYTTDPDAAVLSYLCRETGGMYLFCPSADAAAHDPELALQRAQQILSAAATPALRTRLHCCNTRGEAVAPQLMDLQRPLRPLPGATLRLPFSLDEACTFALEMQCLDGSVVQARAAWDPALALAAVSAQAQRDVDAARLAAAAQQCEAEHGDGPLRSLLHALRAREDAAEALRALGQAMDLALGPANAQTQERKQAQEQAAELAREAVLACENLLARAAMPATLPHLAAHLSSLSQGGSGGGNAAYGGGSALSNSSSSTEDTVLNEAMQLATVLSQTLSHDGATSHEGATAETLAAPEPPCSAPKRVRLE
jgi:hypothetical protein